MKATIARSVGSLALMLGLLAASASLSASQTVDAFYKWYIGATRNGYWAGSFDDAKPYLEPSLWQAIDTANKRGEREGRAILYFDPFDDAQAPASSYLLGKARSSAAAASVPVTMQFAKSKPITFVVHLKRDGGKWLIDDFAYQSGNTLRGILAKTQ
jgi:hypothetical protein